MHSPAAPADPFASATLGPLTLRNRLIKCATFEGMTPDALVTDELIDFHRTHAAGGVAISTVAYCAISRKAAPTGTRSGCVPRRCRVCAG